MFAATVPVEITLRLSPDQADALARFVQRADYDDFERRADDSDDAYRMLHGAGALRRAFKAAGIEGG